MKQIIYLSLTILMIISCKSPKQKAENEVDQQTHKIKAKPFPDSLYNLLVQIDTIDIMQWYYTQEFPGRKINGVWFTQLDDFLARKDSTNTIWSIPLDSAGTIIGTIWCTRKDTTDSLWFTRKPVGEVWKKGYYKDEFGDPTNESYIETRVRDISSNIVYPNTITEDKDLSVDIIIDKNSIKLLLSEGWRDERFGSYNGIGNNGIILFKNQAGEILRITDFETSEVKGSGFIYDRYYFTLKSNERLKLISFLKSSVGNIRVIIKDDKNQIHFEIDATGFAPAYNNL